MKFDSSCSVYELRSLNGAIKVGAYRSCDECIDQSLCHAFSNRDKNHFYFCNPDIAKGKNDYTNSCLQCGNLCYDEFCSDTCKALFDGIVKPLAVKNKPYHYRFVF